MSRFSHQISFTSSARHSLLHDPVDPLGAVRGPIEALGGTLVDAFFTEDSYDVLAITEFPDSVSPDQISIAFYAGGSVARLHSSLLRSAAEAHVPPQSGTVSRSFGRQARPLSATS